MKVFKNFGRGLTLTVLVWLAVAACGDAHRQQIAEQAHAWADRLNDSTGDTVRSVFADSAWVDSISASWSTDDRMYFWSEVERTRAARK